jgi:hypothetical protein
MKYLSILFASLLFVQLSTMNSNAQSRTEWTGNANAVQLLDIYRRTNGLKESVPGFRIQIYSGGDREKVRETKSKFLASNLGWAAYESYQSPNFRIRVGDFRSRLEASASLKAIQMEFPSAFVVEDDIHLPVLEP